MQTRVLASMLAASILSIVACGGDDSSTSGPGSGGTGGASGSGGSTGGKGGSAGSTGGSAGTAGSTGGGGQAGSTSNDASTGNDARAGSGGGTSDASSDRATTPDTSDSGSQLDVARDNTTTPDTSSPDTGSTDTGSDAPSNTDAGGADVASDGSSAMVLTSTSFSEGMTIPAIHTCAKSDAGTNMSPPFNWTPGPTSTMSYAIVLTDKTNTLVHAGIYDIPANVNALPQNIEKVQNPATPAGSKQVRDYNNMFGYAGPCPGAMAHTYEFKLYAVDTAMLPGLTASSKGADLVTALSTHTLGTATLTGKATTFR